MEKFNLQPELSGQLLNLRPLASSDFENLYSVSSDPLVWQQHPENNRYKRDIFERFFKAAIESQGALIASDAKTNEVIGSSRFTGLDLANNRIEVGYTFLARKCWGKGFNREMKKLMLSHVFQYVNQVHFYIGEDNLRSRKAIEKIGARFIERLERQPKEGAKYSSVIYRIEKSDFNLYFC